MVGALRKGRPTGPAPTLHEILAVSVLGMSMPACQDQHAGWYQDDCLISHGAMWYLLNLNAVDPQTSHSTHQQSNLILQVSNEVQISLSSRC